MSRQGEITGNSGLKQHYNPGPDMKADLQLSTFRAAAWLPSGRSDISFGRGAVGNTVRSHTRNTRALNEVIMSAKYS